jgi:polysaccharide biosynthesis transport protein
MDLRQLLTLAARWSWLLVLLAVVAGASAYGFHLLTAPMAQFRAEALALVGPALSADADPSELDAAARVAETYASVATSAVVLDEVARRTGVSLRDLSEIVDVSASPDTSVIVIEAHADTPDRAVEIANAVLDELAVVTSSDDQAQSAEGLAFIRQQAAAIRTEIVALSAEGEVLAADPDRTAAEDARLETIQTRLVDLRTSYAQLTEAAARGGSTTLTALEQASTAKMSLSRLLVTFMGALLGLTLGIAAAVIAEKLDTRIRSADDIRRVAGYRHLGNVRKLPRSLRSPGRNGLLAAPQSEFGQSIQSIRANIEFAADAARTIVVTSARRQEGRTTVASNLAVAFARAGREVLLIDADVAAPAVHRAYGLLNRQGFTDLLRWPDGPWSSLVHSTPQPRLSVMTAGLPVHGTHDMAGLRATVQRLVESTEALVIIDGPPIAEGSEAVELASSCDGTILVVALGTTTTDDLEVARQALAQARAVITGTIGNPASGSASTRARDRVPLAGTQPSSAALTEE